MSRRSHVIRGEGTRQSARTDRFHWARSMGVTLGLVLAASGPAVGPAGAVPAAPQPVASKIESVVVTYNDDAAPDLEADIAEASAVWNSSVSNVTFVETDGAADLYFYEGVDQTADEYNTDGHGHGWIYLPGSLAGTHPIRIIAHILGHILGLPDHYSGPCSELMSGGGPGTSCANVYPNATERATVDSLWATGPAAGPLRGTATLH
ncbi:snapalysin family zinc-dependent metalloprotease [Streptomyces sp. NPDC005925]|uniref:snapalysin family zinc-dependent metalloprotease n=1 Tax=Streptomyces sp. NPDC005925 TaxID=3157172 RepID=UPI0033FCFB0D